MLKDTLLVMMTSIGKRGDVARLQRLQRYLTKPIQDPIHECLLMVVNPADIAGTDHYTTCCGGETKAEDSYFISRRQSR
jgi:hypothetical protein